MQLRMGPTLGRLNVCLRGNELRPGHEPGRREVAQILDQLGWRHTKHSVANESMSA